MNAKGAFCPLHTSPATQSRDSFSQFVDTRLCFFFTHKWIGAENDQKLKRHDAPDERLADNDGHVAEIGDQEYHEQELDHQFRNAGNQGKQLGADALHGAAELDQNAQNKIERPYKPQIQRSIFNDHGFLGAGDQFDQSRGEKQQEDGDDCRSHEIEQIGVAQGFSDSFPLVCAAILGNKRADRVAHRAKGHHKESVNPACGGVAGDNQRAEAVDAILQDHSAGGDDGVHEPHGQPLPQHFAV